MIASNAMFSHTNGQTTEERFVLRVMKKKEEEDDELGVFGAEKYFKGVIDDELLRTSNRSVHSQSNQPKEKQEPCPVSKPKTPSSVHSESSSSRKGLLVSNDNNHSKKTSVKNLLASLCCNCNDKGSVTVTEVKQQVKGGDLGQKTKSVSSKWANELVHIKRETLSNVLDSSRNEGQNETGSDASSDLFEIESFTKNENNSLLAPQAIEKNGYAPSEASVDWSVVTASMADLSTTEDLGVSRNVKGSGILSGCKSLKAVRITGDECGKTGGEKTTVSVLPARREWCHRLDSGTPVAKIQAGTKLIVAGSDYSNRSQNRFGIT